MAEWQQFDPSDLFPDDVAAIADELTDVTDALSASLGALGDVIGIIAEFSDDIFSVSEELIQAAQDLILSVFQQLTQTGIYWLHHMSPSVSYTLPPHKWLAEVGNSLYDRMDENAPILLDPNAFVGTVVIAATSENMNSLFKDYANLLTLLGISLGRLGTTEPWPEFGDAFSVEEGVGRAPDWRRKNVVDIIPGLGDLAETMIGFSDMLSGPVVSSALYKTFGESLQAKADRLAGIGTVLRTVLDTIALILNFDGAFVLPIYGQGDRDWVRDQMLNSTGGPLDQEDANFTVGAVFLATGGTDASVLFDLFGLPKEETS